MKKILISLLTVFTFLSGTTVMADTKEVVIDLSDDSTVNVDIKGVLPGTENSSIEHTHFKLTDDGQIAYCSNGTNGTPDVKDVWSNCQVWSGPKSKSLAYIYENGYGSYKDYASSNYLVGNKIEDYFITQMAVWIYTIPPEWVKTRFNYNTTPATFTTNTDGTTYSGADHVIIQKIANLINDAERAANGPTLKITPSGNMSLTLVGDYYVSNAIRISGDYLNSKITVNLGQDAPEGSFVTTTTTGNAQTTNEGVSVSNNSNIYVKIPVKNVLNIDKIEFSLTANATSAIGEGKIIECKHSDPDNIQDIILYNPSNENLTEDVEYSVDTVNVKISKRDTNGEMLKGARLSVKQGDTVIQSWNTEEDSQNLSLLPGTYTLNETKTPNGYIVNNDIITFVVNQDGKVYVNNKAVNEIVVVNKPIIINISKRVIKGDEELSGATLRITDSDGNVAKDVLGNSLEWVTSNETKSFHVEVGTYVLEEIEAPSGYELSDKKIEFTVNEDGTVTVKEGLLISKDVILEDNLIVFENTPVPENLPTGSIVLYIAIFVGTVAIGVTTFLIIKKYKK